MVFTSKHPEIDYPTNLTVWEWAFEDATHSPLFNNPPDKVAGFVDAASHQRVSFAQVKEHATHLSTALVKKYGFQKDDTVSIFSHNTIWYPVGMFAVLRAGGRVNGASPAYTAAEMSHALRTAGTKWIMTVPDSINVAMTAAKEAGIPKERIFLLDGQLDGFTTVQELIQTGKGYGDHGQAPFFRVPGGQTNDICGYLTFSSGTTGLPKAVMLSHRNVIAQCLQLKAVAGPDRKIFLASLPLFHISGLVRFLHWPIASNDDCVMLPRFTLEAFLKAIVEHQVTDLTLVPAIVNRLVNDPTVNADDLRCVKRIACGAAPLGPEVLEQLRAKFPWTGFRQSYGMTESCCCLTTHPPEFYSYAYGHTGGTLLGSTVIKIVDVSTKKELGPNETGEILAKGPQIAMGYWANEKETAETFGADGYLRTGDIGQIDSEGFIHIVDRIKEMIKVKGQQVAPAELESLLLGLDSVADCAVVGMPDASSGERPRAYVVLKPGVKPSEEIGREIIRHVKERRVRYKWIREVEFIAEIPKSPSSKILRRVLRDKSKAGERGFTVQDASSRARL
ncbi:hypothetical protein BDV18DRAFT_62600 [Aspergillus unguis]